MTSPSQFIVHNSAGPSGYMDGIPYTGPVAGIDTELDLPGTNSWHVDALVHNVFVSINGSPLAGALPEMNFIDVSADVSGSGGNNILNGGAGSSFLYGGTGNDTFYVDGRETPSTNPNNNVWSTLKGLHVGDTATVWGVTPQDFALTWLDNQGAGGSNNGLTAVFVKYGAPEVGVTLAGMTSADLTNGHLAVSYGRTPDMTGLPGSTYMHIGIQ